MISFVLTWWIINEFEEYIQVYGIQQLQYNNNKKMPQ